MTTAHRPTWHNALGGENQGGNRLIPTQKVSSRDQPGNLTLKQRKPEQGPQTTNKKKLEQQLQAKEKQAAAARRKLASTLTALPAEHYVNPFPEDADDGDYRPAAALLGGSSSQQQRGSSKDARGGGAAGEKDTAGGSSSEDLSDDESDEEQELLRELEKIKQERREEERAKRAAEEKKKEAEQKERMLRANPLLLDPELTGGGEGGHAGAVKRRWDDEVVFKNQAKNLPKAKKQFINDPVRSEFHKKFLSKYIV